MQSGGVVDCACAMAMVARTRTMVVGAMNGALIELLGVCRYMRSRRGVFMQRDAMAAPSTIGIPAQIAPARDGAVGAPGAGLTFDGGSVSRRGLGRVGGARDGMVNPGPSVGDVSTTGGMFGRMVGDEIYGTQVCSVCFCIPVRRLFRFVCVLRPLNARPR